MPRRSRVVLPNVPLHLIQRGNNRQACFFSDTDRRVYLDTIFRSAYEFGCRIHAYVLMTNHVHMLLSVNEVEAPGRLMKALGQRYVQYVNRTYQRSGTLWEGRYRSCLVQDETHLLTCQRYIELNPVRAGMVDHPGDYRWSSYRANAQGETDRLVTAHPICEHLGSEPSVRQAAYRDLFKEELPPALIDDIRQATHGDFALGDEQFTDTVSQALGRRVTPGQSGRPRKESKHAATERPGKQ